MDPRLINLFVLDTRENFEKSKEFFGRFKQIVCIENIEDLDNYFDTSLLSDDEHIYLVVHVFAFDKLKGIKKFLSSGISEKYQKLIPMFITDAEVSENDIKHAMVNYKMPHTDIYYYHEVASNLKNGRFEVLTKGEILEIKPSTLITSQSDSMNKTEGYPQCDYAIITALELAEMEKILPIITETGRAKNKRHRIKYGHLVSNSKKKIVYASQLATGMIDAAILAAELIIRFEPKFLIMAGVLGGKPDSVKIGDAVVATKIFTIDKGKITDQGFERELESIDIDGAHITDIKTSMNDIINFVQKEDSFGNRINIHFEPIASVRQVVNLEGYFREKIEPVERKAVALEMESYGVVRACKLVNDGKTEPLIIKSAMDNTKDKVDKAKGICSLD